MNYPDGSPIRTGDLIWWNEGIAVSHVGEIMEEPGEYEADGLTEPSLVINDVHPFDGSGGRVVYPYWALESEGVGKLSDSERREFERALREAAQRASRSFEGIKFGVRAEVENCKMVGWIFLLLGDDGHEVERVLVPRPPESLHHHTPV